MTDAIDRSSDGMADAVDSDDTVDMTDRKFEGAGFNGAEVTGVPSRLSDFPIDTVGVDNEAPAFR